MALVACAECRHQISTRAVACPRCGCPVVPHRTAGSPHDEPSEPVTLNVGPRTVTVPGTPLPRKARTAGCVEPSVGPDASPAAAWADRGSFVLRPDGRVYRALLRNFVVGVAGIVFFGAAAAFLALHPQLIPGREVPIPVWPVALLALGSLLWLLLWNYAILFGARTVRFNSGLKLMTFGPSWARRSRPLSEIVAVQIVFESLPSRRTSQASSKRYQMNLVLDDPNTPRLGLVVSADRVWTERAAQQLADFLSVPLARQLGREETAK